MKNKYNSAPDNIVNKLMKLDIGIKKFIKIKKKPTNINPWMNIIFFSSNSILFKEMTLLKKFP